MTSTQIYQNVLSMLLKLILLYKIMFYKKKYNKNGQSYYNFSAFLRPSVRLCVCHFPIKIAIVLVLCFRIDRKQDFEDATLKNFIGAPGTEKVPIFENKY